MDEKNIINDFVQKLSIVNPIIITDINLRIIAVNNSWVNMCKFSHEEAFGNTPKLLQGPLTNTDVARSFASTLCTGTSTFASIINYKKDGKIFINHLYGWSMGDLFIAETYKSEDCMTEPYQTS
tara:strand:+ start:440 stop:811 length:372 start_codon:yes stop_codon:yes gene_type:complete